MPVAVEEDLDAVEIPEDDYLCELVERAPASSSLLEAMRDLPTFWGIFEFATGPDKAQPDMLAKVEAELLLSQKGSGGGGSNDPRYPEEEHLMDLALRECIERFRGSGEDDGSGSPLTRQPFDDMIAGMKSDAVTRRRR